MGNCISSSPASVYEVDSHNTTPNPDSAQPPQPLKQLSQFHSDIVFAVTTTNASNTMCSASADGCIRVFDWEADRILHTYRHEKSVHKLHYNSATRMLFSGSRDTTVKQWNLNSDSSDCVQTYRGHELVVMGLATNTEGSILATGSRDYSVNFWDVTTAQKLASNQTTLNMVTGLKHLDSNLFVQTSEDLKMRIWDTNAQEVQSFALTQYFPLDVDVSADASQILTSHNGFESDGCSVELWDRRVTARPLKSMSGHEQAANSCCFLPNHSAASCSKDGTVRIWDLVSGSCVACLPCSSEALTSIRCSRTPKGVYLCVGSTSGAICVLKWQDGALQFSAQSQF